MNLYIRSAAFLLLAPALAAGLASADDFYKWVDDKGQVHYSDSKDEAIAKGKAAEKKSFSEIEMNVVPPAQWPASIFPADERPVSDVKKKESGRNYSAGSLPWFSQSGFDYDVLRSGQLTLVEFWAVWCGVCRKVDPVINDLAREYGGKVKFGRVDIDKEKALASKYQVRGVPNLIFFKDGKMIGRMIGGYSRDSYVKMIESNL